MPWTLVRGLINIPNFPEGKGLNATDVSAWFGVCHKNLNEGIQLAKIVTFA